MTACNPRQTTKRQRPSRNDAASGLPLLQRPLFLLGLLLFSNSFFPTCHAWIPPRPGTEVAANWESVQDMRVRLGQAWNYTPSLIHPEICRHLTEHECQDVDEGLQDHARRHRALQEERRHNPNLGTFKVRFPVAVVVVDRIKASLDRLYLIILFAFVSIFQVLVLLVVFSDHTDRPLIDKSDVENTWNTLVPEWFDENSFGTYND